MKCALCLQDKILVESHAIPNAVFRNLFRQTDGKAIGFRVDDSTHIKFTSDSWSEKLLCEDCESFLNESYDRYGISLFRGKQKNVKWEGNFVSFKNIDRSKIIGFLLSVVWRAAISSRREYSKVKMSPEYKEEFRIKILNQAIAKSNFASVKVSRMITNTAPFTSKIIKDVVLSPFLRATKYGLSLSFLYEGFLIDIYVPAIKLKYRQEFGFIKPGIGGFVVPTLSAFKIPEIVEAFRIALIKDDLGMSDVGS